MTRLYGDAIARNERWPLEADALPNTFWSNVLSGTSSGCWYWMGAKSKDGYGRFHVDHKAKRAHRVAYEAFFGSICDEEGRYLELDHLCRNTVCVNPTHLEPVTQQENLRRMWAARV